MRKAVRVVVLAVALVQSSAVAGNELVLTDARIAECRAMLKLSAGQEQYWAPIEATLRDIARRANAPGAALDDKSRKRLLAVAMPLFQTLGPEQKRALISLAHSLGLLRVAFTF